MAAARGEVTIDLDEPVTAAETVIDLDEPAKPWNWADPPLPSQTAAGKGFRDWVMAHAPRPSEATQASLEAAKADQDKRDSPETRDRILQQTDKIPGFGPVYRMGVSGVAGANAAFKHIPQVMGLPGMAVQAVQHISERNDGRSTLGTLSEDTRKRYDEEKEMERSRELQMKALATAKKIAAEKK